MRGPEMTSLLERVELLERENRALAERLEREARSARSWRVALIFMAVAGAFTPLAARLAFSSWPSEVSAHQFTLRDGQGKSRAEIYLHEGKIPIFAMYDEQMKKSVEISAGNDGLSGLIFYGPSGKSRLSMGGYKNGAEGINLNDSDGRKAASLAIDSAGSAALSFYDQGNRKRISAGSRSDGVAGFTVFDRDGKTSFTTLPP